MGQDPDPGTGASLVNKTDKLTRSSWGDHWVPASHSARRGAQRGRSVWSFRAWALTLHPRGPLSAAGTDKMDPSVRASGFKDDLTPGQSTIFTVTQWKQNSGIFPLKIMESQYEGAMATCSPKLTNIYCHKMLLDIKLKKFFFTFFLCMLWWNRWAWKPILFRNIFLISTVHPMWRWNLFVTKDKGTANYVISASVSNFFPTNPNVLFHTFSTALS